MSKMNIILHICLLSTVINEVNTHLLEHRELQSKGSDCEKCFLLNRNNCWDHRASGSGSWSKSYCCSSGDSNCRYKDYCSSSVSSKILKEFTCAAEQSKCPSGSSAEIRTRYTDKVVIKTDSWSSSQTFRQLYCKISVKHSGSYVSDRFKYNSMNIQVSKMSQTKAYLIKMPKDGIFDNSVRYSTLSQGSEFKFDRIDEEDSQDLEWWIFYKPTRVKTGSI